MQNPTKEERLRQCRREDNTMTSSNSIMSIAELHSEPPEEGAPVVGGDVVLAEGESDLDYEQLHRARTGGYEIYAGTSAFTSVGIYRTGPAYGLWGFFYDRKGAKVWIDHRVPTSYHLTGRFDESVLECVWTISAEAWHVVGLSVIERLVGKRVARAIYPLVPVPEQPVVATA
jgi:hypothetical protein